MIISLDFDDTFTADRETWTKVASVLADAGHEVICISGRIDEESNQTELRQSLPDSIERIYLCGAVSKKHYAETHSIPVDVWIDDSPTRIVQAKDRVVRSCCARRSR
jgi:hypothetical protein